MRSRTSAVSGPLPPRAGPLQQRDRADARRPPQRQLGVAVLAGDVRVHVLHRDPGVLRDEVAQPGRVQDGAGPEQLRRRQAGDLERRVGDHVDGVGHHHVDGVRRHLDEGRQDLADEPDGGLREVEARLAGLLLGAGREHDDVGVGAHRDVVGADHLGHRHELDAVPEVQRLGLDLRRVDVVERHRPGRTAQERRVGHGRPDGPRTDDRQLRGAPAAAERGHADVFHVQALGHLTRLTGVAASRCSAEMATARSVVRQNAGSDRVRKLP